MVVVIGNKRVDMGCGFTHLFLKDLEINQEINLPMIGGNLEAKTKIKDEDIHANRGSLWGKMGKMGSKINPELRIRIRNIDHVRSNQPLIDDLDLLPKTILIPKASLNWVKSYRLYLGVKSSKNGVLYKNIGSEISVRAMMKAYNLSSVQRAISDSWTKKIMPELARVGEDYERFIV